MTGSWGELEGLNETPTAEYTCEVRDWKRNVLLHRSWMSSSCGSFRRIRRYGCGPDARDGKGLSVRRTGLFRRHKGLD